MGFDFKGFLDAFLSELKRAQSKPAAPAKAAAAPEPATARSTVRLPIPDPPRRIAARPRVRSTMLPQGTGTVRAKGAYVEELCDDGVWRLQHRIVMANELGRTLKSDEEVHHCDINPRNNHPRNLAVVSKTHHNEIHRLWRDYEAALRKGHTRVAESIREERKDFIRRNAIRK